MFNMGESDESLSGLDDLEVHEVGHFDFTFYVNDNVPNSSSITKEDRSMGKDSLKALILSSCPRVVCFVGAREFKHFNKRTVDHYGLQKKYYYYTSDGTRRNSEVFLLPSGVAAVNVTESDRIFSEE
jgi:hypothetical protein